MLMMRISRPGAAPAFATMMSTPPRSCTARCTMVSTCSLRDTSTATQDVRRPSEDRVLAHSSAALLSTSAMRTRDPARPSCLAMASPIPLAPPVTIATLLARLAAMLRCHCQHERMLLRETRSDGSGLRDRCTKQQEKCCFVVSASEDQVTRVTQLQPQHTDQMLPGAT
jgi:hypothetical protein